MFGEIKTWIKEISTKPIWSSLIAAAFFGAFSIILSGIYSLFTSRPLFSILGDILKLEFPIWFGLLVGFLIWIIVRVIKRCYHTIFRYDSKSLNLDTELFDKIRGILNNDRAIHFLRNNNFAGFSFNPERIDDLHNFEHECTNPNFEFQNPKLEKMRLELATSISHFTDVIAFQTFPTSGGWQSVPEEWETDQPERFQEVVHDLHKTAQKICASYDELIKTGLKIIK